MRRILRYSLKVGEITALPGRPLHVAHREQDPVNVVAVWCEEGHAWMDAVAVATSEPWPDDEWAHEGSVLFGGGVFVWHVLARPAAKETCAGCGGSRNVNGFCSACPLP